MRDHAVVRLNLETELRRAIENDELKLFYQPVIALKNGALSGFEALLRWERAGGEMIPPPSSFRLRKKPASLFRSASGSWARLVGRRRSGSGSTTSTSRSR